MELEELVKLRKHIQKKYKKKHDDVIDEGLKILNKIIRDKKGKA